MTKKKLVIVSTRAHTVGRYEERKTGPARTAQSVKSQDLGLTHWLLAEPTW